MWYLLLICSYFRRDFKKQRFKQFTRFKHGKPLVSALFTPERSDSERFNPHVARLEAGVVYL